MFVIVGTMFFAPMIVPAGTINTVLVPHALLLVAPDPAYYFWIPQYILTSFAITAIIFIVIAKLIIRKRPQAKGVDWRTFSYPLLALTSTFVVFKAIVPDRDIPLSITTAAVERAYGSSIDAVIALHRIEDATQQGTAVADLKSRFSEDAAIIHVSLEDPGHAGGVYGQVFYFYQDDLSPPSKTCSGTVPPEQKGLQRCSWKGGGTSRRNVIRYMRGFSLDDEELVVVFEFDFKAMGKTLRDLPHG